MTTLTNTYPTEVAARRAVETLHATCVPERDIRLLVGSAPRDIRDEPVGGFAGQVAPDAPVGTYGGRILQRRQGAGSFAGDPDGQRQGTFAGVDRVVIVACKDSQEHSRVSGYRAVRRLLRRAALDDGAIDCALRELRVGHTVVLVDAAEMPATAVRAHLEQVAQAA